MSQKLRRGVMRTKQRERELKRRRRRRKQLTRIAVIKALIDPSRVEA